MKRVTLVVLAACGSSVDEPTPDPTPAIVEPPPPRPAPGMDLSGPLAAPDGAPAPRKPAVPIDLAADRAVIKVDVPVPPRGGAVGFSFGDDRRGWVTGIPEGQQLPSVAYAHDRVYVSGGFQSVSFYALSASTGRIDWATSNLEDNGPTAAVVEGDDVLFNTESCTLFALDAKTGKRKWYRYLGDPTLTQVAVTDGLVYAAHPSGRDFDQSVGFRLSAFHIKNGALAWTRGIDGELLATPVISGDSVYASTVGGTTYRFDHRTGKLAWAKALRATTAPWIAGDELFVTRRVGGKEQQVVVATATGKIVREHRTSPAGYAHDVPFGGDYAHDYVWAFEGSRPVVDRGITYVAMGNEVVASDAKSGEAIWHRRYQKPGRTLGSVALAGSTIVVASRDGKVFGLDVDTGFTLWSYDIGKRVVAEPIIAKGWLYATTTDGYVIALDVADKSLDGWHMFGGNAKKNGLVTPPPPPPALVLEGQPDAQAAAPDPIDSAQRALDSIVKQEAYERSLMTEVEPEPPLPSIGPQEKPLTDAQQRALREKQKQGFHLPDACLTSVLCK